MLSLLITSQLSFANDIQNGKKLYTRLCSPCHGVNAEKSALTMSNIIKGWDKNKIKNRINFYKENNKISTKFQKIMKSQVKNLSKKEIEDITSYISTLK